jgi:hypothetical protein
VLYQRIGDNLEGIMTLETAQAYTRNVLDWHGAQEIGYQEWRSVFGRLHE